MKTGAHTSDGSGLLYRGPFVYAVSSSGALSLESVAVPCGRLTTSGPRYHVTDHLGSVVAVVDGSSGASLTDFGARHYSPALRRWLTPDPLCENYYDTSPYVYCDADPVNIVDPDGKNWYSRLEDGEVKYIYVEGQMCQKDMEKGGYTDLGYTYHDNDGNYYSLFGKIIPPGSKNDNSFVNYHTYQHIDNLIIKYYTTGGERRKENFYLGIKPGMYPISYSGASFESSKTRSFFNAVKYENKSILSITDMPQKNPVVIPSDLSNKHSYVGFKMVLSNQFNYDSVQVLYSQENANKLTQAIKRLFAK